jgi:hypothetical protein
MLDNLATFAFGLLGNKLDDFRLKIMLAVAWGERQDHGFTWRLGLLMLILGLLSGDFFLLPSNSFRDYFNPYI